MSTASNPQAAIGASERRKLVRRWMTQYAAYLRPGERFEAQGERSDDYSYLKMALSSPDGQDQLELEAAMLRAEQEGLAYDLSPMERFEGLCDFLQEQIYDYFCADRSLRFHPDYRIYAEAGIKLRFRGQRRAPRLEERAEELLDEAQDHGQA